MRSSFVQALIESAKTNSKIMLLTGDLGFNVLEPFVKKFPKQFLNVGVGESNLIGVAAGLSSAGYKPFVYSIANFAVIRPFEQIRNDISLQNLDVVIVGVGAGLAYNKAGPTHHTYEDIALLRTLPNLAIVSPHDQKSCYQATKDLCNHPGPAYLRIERDPLDTKLNYRKNKFRLGKAQEVYEGKKIALLSVGTKLSFALEVRSKLLKKGIDLAVYSFPTITPFDHKMLKKITKKYKHLYTLEEHRLDGGFGSLILETLSSMGSNKTITRLGLKNEFTKKTYDYESLINHHKISPQQIYNKILRETK